MSLLVDTSVWSLALRRDGDAANVFVQALHAALAGDDSVMSAGLILQELLQGFSGPQARAEIIARFSAIPCVTPDRKDHIDAAELRNASRRSGVQIGTIDALLGQLCIRYQLVLLTADKDFTFLARHSALRVWMPLA